MLRREIPGLIPITPKGDKQARAQSVSPQVESGNVWLPGAPNSDSSDYDRSSTPAWVQGFVDELAGFPNAAFDDQVDAFSQAISRMSRTLPRIRVLC